MAIPKALLGDNWTPKTARHALPIVVAAAQQGRCITYGEIDREIVKRKLGRKTLPVVYGYPAGAIGNATIELGERWGEDIPPLNAIIVNAKDGMPGEGVDSYLERYFNSKRGAGSYTARQRQAIVEEIQADVFAFKDWGRVLEACKVKKTSLAPVNKPSKEIQSLMKSGWSSEPESAAHKKLKAYIAENPALVGLPKGTRKGNIEYLFASADRADVVFKTTNGFLGVEVKSKISNEADLTRGVFQAVKYQALLRAEQKSRRNPPTATAVVVSENRPSAKLRALAEILRIEIFVISCG